MCGFLAVVRKVGRRLPAEAIVPALSTMRRRGPDDEGYAGLASGAAAVTRMRGIDTLGRRQWPVAREELLRHDWDVVLGHRRLSIIDLSEAGHQPMGSASCRTWIAYNGEIYNYLELRAELEGLGQQFRTRTDTEVLLSAYETWGDGMLDRLEGMFAFALLDLSLGVLFIARDPFGIKPLYHAETDDFVAFASQTDSLRRLPGIPGRGDTAVAVGYLWLGERTAGERTFFESIRALPAAHCQTVRIAEARTAPLRRYWSCRQAEPRDVGYDDAVASVRGALFDSVRLHLRSDVSLGSCLSGGLDSSAIVATMRRLSSREQQVHTFSFISEDVTQSEEPYVDLVEGVMRHKVHPVADDVQRDLDRLLDAQEVPFGTLSIYAQFKVFELASQSGVKVMLDGQGADEVFGGYDSIVLARAAILIASGRFGDAWRVMNGVPAANGRARIRNALAVLARVAAARGLGEPVGAVRQSIGAPPWLVQDYLKLYRKSLAAAPGAEFSVRSELHDYLEQTTLPQLLRYEDLNSMYFSIESRVPFCSRRLVDLVSGLPDRYLVSDTGRTKSVLRSAVADLVPEMILNRRKVGFVAPDARWLRSGFDALMARCREATDACPPFLDLATFEKWGRRQLASPTPSGALWRGLNLVLWSSTRGVSW